jgi:hypothetical protein
VFRGLRGSLVPIYAAVFRLPKPLLHNNYFPLTANIELNPATAHKTGMYMIP